MERTQSNLEREDVFASSEAHIATLRARNSLQEYSEHWKRLSGGGKVSGLRLPLQAIFR